MTNYGMNSLIIYLDIELCDNIPEGWDRESPSPLDIACICTLVHDGDKKKCDVAHNEGKPMTDDQIKSVCDIIKDVYNRGGEIVTWNGVGFDMQLLGKADPDIIEIITSKAHIDLMFHFTRKKGYMIGLGKVAEAFGVGSKTMTGLDAVKLWNQGEFQKVIDYNINDVKILMKVHRKVHKHSKIKWLTRANNITYLKVEPTELSVMNSIQIPRPPNTETSWMSEEHRGICEWAWRVKV